MTTPCEKNPAQGKQWTDDAAREIALHLFDSYACGHGVSYRDTCALPEQSIVTDTLENLIDLLFPGYTGRQRFTREGAYFIAGNLLNRTYQTLSEQITRALLHADAPLDAPPRQYAETATIELLDALPNLRDILWDDAQAALEGDPATKSLDEIILAYPGFKCITCHRLAHELYARHIPLVPRIMSEYAHTVTGIDIHPGATIGRHFFIDHGTGVVIGETTVIGDNVKLYQGVTLGALSFPKDATGHLVKGAKRHPNIEDDVTIYAESTILGNVTIGHHSVIGGNTWLTESVPPYSKVTIEPSKVTIKEMAPRGVSPNGEKHS
ncbi:MAG: serine acetyltransferase [Victivallales bacterium]|nr:serine acetyltransferase [Victivallales bacterium]